MHLHEYQAKDLLTSYQLPIPPYHVATSLSEAEVAIQAEQWRSGVVKAQVHAGGRGKNGGVIVARSPEDLLAATDRLLHMQFSSNQTAGLSLPVNKVLISPLVEIALEYYIAIVIDRKHRCPVIMLSKSGGIDIEEIAEKQPDLLLKIALPSSGKIYAYQLRHIAKFMEWDKLVADRGNHIIRKLLQCFYDNDASLLEINPLVLTKDGDLIILDAKITIDDNALYRHPQLADWYDPSQENIRDVLAKQLGLSYIALDGTIGCLVNGAGLAMSTLDILKLYGGSAANFLDVGGSASEKQIQEAISLVLSDKNVRVLFIHIFGGIMDCAVVASGLVSAMQGQQGSIPTVIRLEGTNVDKGKEIILRSGIPCEFVASMSEGAELAVKLSR
ncbi:ADP-forming succinate--CoA ligase subunit beta [Chlamydia trachomatis]|jgi:succinyl-CoA synthetase, beta subunit|uniref:Succinate--CoA ligase [ADP-forming] subunit beta n=2 Tax=Chlamydia muridarum TaxID=83560 RepID=SUCC_CHLMU|nr:ADP-forming succinate--CoA ligase subunit beta [Chlamydia muridarum]Q9PL99.1 RecName: Full=Succinate--CoA ligase [ADP-forming] subunit beta; AltName: Full=Succinyl-CoA synthetase subunit beta; Short=SCS-beta [Chlamydia muridarum str. Nigg]UFV53781.1 ADP-forming succinate--CoA ligase subunit beta [Chlamydia trachomatis]AAF39080.1 succinyl-CoA synthetase, beta subunit [Chlamydia muridarum str. Nigg]AHH22600.1 malate--CoA ligase subunit beta [Chlamydia muridarum str. Nigg3 CMUT3-5]AHH23524.1 m